jgi:hypothetical protein
LTSAAIRRSALLLPLVLLGVLVFMAAQLPISAGTASSPTIPKAVLKEAATAVAQTMVHPSTPAPAPAPPAPTTTTTTVPTPPPTPPAPPVTTPTAAVAATPAPAPAPAPTPASSDPATLPAVGQATAWGCGAAIAYLQAYAAKGFTLQCPGYADGREAMTCWNTSSCPGSAVIAIADACPQAYMNEASNSLVMTGAAEAPIDPYGPCPS